MLFAQYGEDLYIYGSVQGIFLQENLQTDNYTEFIRLDGEKLLDSNSTTSDETNRNTFTTQQFNLFLTKFFNSKLNLFVDLQMTQNYNSRNGWGELSIQEAWVNYEFSNQFQVKFGQLFPQFNNLNEIKNRLNLLNYLFRPIVYESILDEIVTSEDFIPETAFLQLHGTIPTKPFYIDWAFYMGNSEPSSLSSLNDPEHQDFLSGADMNDLNKKLYGGRIGIRTKSESIKLGISGTHDYNDGGSFFRRSINNNLVETQNVIKDQRRIRLGLDLNINYKNFTLEAEYSFSEMDTIEVNREFADFDNAFDRHEAWNRFYYITLNYDFLEDYFAYLGYSEIEFELFEYISHSDYITAGAGWRINPWLSLKAQCVIFKQEVIYPVLFQNQPAALRPYRLENFDIQNTLFVTGFSAHF
jgi:hypothetical protein